MKNFGAVALSVFLALSIGGCASTSESASNAGPVYPTLKVLSDTPYVWDNSISEALNVARMAQPADVGHGMVDYKDGTKATTGRFSGGERVFDSALGFATMGAFGILSMESLNQSVNNKLDWEPATVDLVKESDILKNGQYSFVDLRNMIAEKHKRAIEKKYPSIVWGDTLTMKDAIKNNKTSNADIMITSDICKNLRALMYRDKDDAKPYVSHNYSKFYLDGKNIEENHCTYAVKISIASQTKVDGTIYLIVVSQVTTGFYLVPGLTENYDGFTIIPDFYKVNSTDVIRAPYAYVTKNGQELKFQSN